jgi:hypothetical protein
MTQGLLTTLKKCSPIRGQFNDASFEPGPEKGVSWVDFIQRISRKKTNSEDDTILGPHGDNGSKPAAGKENHREKPPNDRTKLKSSTPNKYGSMKKTFIKKTKSLTTSTRGDDVVTTQPEDDCNRRMQDVTSPFPKYGNKDRRKWTSIFNCCKYNELHEEE